MSTTPTGGSFAFGTDNLIYGSEPLITESAEVADEAEFERGAVLGRETATGKVKLSLAAAEDGSEEPFAIAAADVNGDEAPRTVVYTKGHFNSRSLHLGAGHTLDTLRPKLRTLGIYLGESAKSADPVDND